MAIVYLCGAVAVIAVILWAAWQRGVLGSLGRAVLVLFSAVVTLVAALAGGYLAAVALGLAHPRDFGGVVLVTGSVMGLVAFGSIALVAWLLTRLAFAHARRAAADAATRPGRGLIGVWPMVSVVSVAVLAAALVSYRAERNKPADDHDIVGVRFVDGVRTIYALDDANVLKIWRLAQPLPLEARKPDGPSPYALQASIPLPITYVPDDMRVSRDGRFVALRDATGVTVYKIDETSRQGLIVTNFRAPSQHPSRTARWSSRLNTPCSGSLPARRSRTRRCRGPVPSSQSKRVRRASRSRSWAAQSHWSPTRNGRRTRSVRRAFRRAPSPSAETPARS